MTRITRAFCRRNSLVWLSLAVVCTLLFSFLKMIHILEPVETVPVGRSIHRSGNVQDGKLLISTNVSRAASDNIMQTCDFKPTLERNLEVIKNYPIQVNSKYRTFIRGKEDHPQIRASFPVFVTALDGGYFDVAQGLFQSIHEVVMTKYNDLKVIVYDLGLAPEQLETLKKYCKCEVRKFPYEEFPDHVQDLQKYAWKPLIIKTVLLETGWVWWMDSSVRFTTSDLDEAVQYSVENSFLFFTYDISFSVAKHTDLQTFEYLRENVCPFRKYGEVEATCVLYHYDDVTKLVVDKWTACALDENCIAPTGTENKLQCDVTNNADGRCHRFDQSVLSIMLRRLYHEQNDYPLVDEPFHIREVRRGEEVSYFPED